MHAQVGNDTERTYVYNNLRERLWGNVAHNQPRLHHGKAEVICYRQPGFQLVENAWNNFRQVAFWNITTFCHRQFGAIFQVLSYPRLVLCAWAECLSWFYHTKKINSTQFIEPLKVKTTSMSWWKRFVSRLQTPLYAHYKRLVVSVQAALQCKYKGLTTSCSKVVFLAYLV